MGGGGKAVMRIVKRRLCRPIAYCDHNISDLFTFRQIGREKLERERERLYLIEAIQLEQCVN